MPSLPPLELLLHDLRALVEVESPSSDADALQRSAAALAELFARRLGAVVKIDADAHVSWSTDDDPDLLLLGHHDTVWPLGTLERLPFTVGETITGPGVYDMKSGLVLLVHALAALAAEGRMPSVEVLITSDEEVGSDSSRDLIRAAARRAGRVLVFEPSAAGGAVKTARKGVAIGSVRVLGRAAHAGLEPEKGINAAVAMGPLLPRLAALSQGDTSVVPTLVTAGATMNTVPAEAHVNLDIRFLDPADLDRVRDGLAALEVAHGATVEARLQLNRSALTPEASAPLVPALKEAAEVLGQELRMVTVGGASDGNIAAETGASVIDGLGPDGDGAHADHEHVVTSSLLSRLELVRALLPRAAAVPR